MYLNGHTIFTMYFFISCQYHSQWTRFVCRSQFYRNYVALKKDKKFLAIDIGLVCTLEVSNFSTGHYDLFPYVSI